MICLELEPAEFITFHLAISNESRPTLISEYLFLVYYWSKSTNLMLILTWKLTDHTQSLLDTMINKCNDFSMVLPSIEIWVDYNGSWTNNI